MQPTIVELTPGMKFDSFLLVRSSEQRMDKNGKPYLDMNLADRTGEINCKSWDGNLQAPKAGSIIKVRALVSEFNGRLQLKIEKLRDILPDDEIDMSLLVACAPEKPEDMLSEILQTVDAFESETLKALVREMLSTAGDRLMYFPAAQRMHHAERSGLLHHTLGMLRMAEHVIEAYPFLHGDLLRAGVILHDLSKIDEMQSDESGNVNDYTRDGILIGHLVRGVVRLQQAADKVGVQGETLELLEHMIISHHGIAEYGSPRQPMFPEAEVLHFLDILDARMNQMSGILERTPAGAFSEQIRSLDRRIYHPHYDDEAE